MEPNQKEQRGQHERMEEEKMRQKRLEAQEDK